MWHVNSVKWQNSDQFIGLYWKLHVLICVDDLLFDTRNPISSRRETIMTVDQNENDLDDVEQVVDAESERINSQRWTDQSFIDQSIQSVA